MINTIDFHIQECESMQNYPNEIFYKGDTNLLLKQKISIVGSRKPNQYAIQKTHEIASKLSKSNVCIVSGGAIGIDTTAHKASNLQNTIMVAGTGLDIRYPAINKKMISELESNALVISQFPPKAPSHKYHFPLRNELIVALGEILIVSYADIKSGTMRSVEYAQKMGKEIYVLPHRIGESDGTNMLLQKGIAKPIYDIDSFINSYVKEAQPKKTKENIILDFCKTNPTYDEAYLKFGSKLFEYELNGDIKINNGIICLA